MGRCIGTCTQVQFGEQPLHNAIVNGQSVVQSVLRDPQLLSLYIVQVQVADNEVPIPSLFCQLLPSSGNDSNWYLYKKHQIISTETKINRHYSNPTLVISRLQRLSVFVLD